MWACEEAGEGERGKKSRGKARKINMRGISMEKESLVSMMEMVKNNPKARLKVKKAREDVTMREVATLAGEVLISLVLAGQ